MPDEFGTRDILEQVDIRLGNVEQDIRGLRVQLDARFERVNDEMAGLRVEIGGVRTEMTSQTRWLVGLFFAGWLTVIASIWLKT